MRRSDAGLSLVEVTIILAVLSTLTAMIAPSIATYTKDAQNVTAQSDVRTIGSAVSQLLRDTGSRCLRLSGTVECTLANRVDLLLTSGSNPRGIDTAQAANIVLPDSAAATNATVNWLPGSAPTQQGLVDDQLINNLGTPYPSASFTGGGGPRMKLGWRGAYLNGPIASDPWGARYQANTLFLTPASTATSGTPSNEGLREAGWYRDVLVLSAGSNGIVETSFGGTATGGVVAAADDVIYVIQGASR